MKIQIPKRGLPISLIAPLALQWATNLGEDPDGLADYIKHEVRECLIYSHNSGLLPISLWEAIAAFIKDLIDHYGGEDVTVVRLDNQPSYYLLHTSFHVLGEPHTYYLYTRINLDGKPPA